MIKTLAKAGFFVAITMAIFFGPLLAVCLVGAGYPYFIGSILWIFFLFLLVIAALWMAKMLHDDSDQE